MKYSGPFKIMMLLLLSITAFTVQAQLSGTYKFSYGFGTKQITFYEGKGFDYNHSHCTGVDIGQGDYSIKGNYLFLRFRDSIANRAWQVNTSSSTTTKDSISILCSLKALYDSSGLAYATIVTKGTGNGAVTDTNGMARLYFPRSSKPVTLEIKVMGANSPCLITLVPDKDHQVSAFLKSDREEYINDGQVYRYEVKNISRNSVRLKEQYEGARWALFERK